MRAYISTVRKLRQYCKTHPFEHAEFSPVYVKTVDATGHRVLEQAIFAPSIAEVAEGFSNKDRMSAYKKLLLRKLVQKKIDPKKISGLALKAAMNDLTKLADELFDRRISVNLGDQFSHVLVTDYNPQTGKLVISIAGNVTDPYSIF